MQLVLCKNRVVAHGENFLSMGGVVINTETGAKYENATVAECSCCPSDIDTVGYEYHAGVFVPCAPYGKGNNNGYFMEVCESCATPRNSGIPIKQGLKSENMHPEFRPSQIGGMDILLLWENASPDSNFLEQTVSLLPFDYTFLLIEAASVVTNANFTYTTELEFVTKNGGEISTQVINSGGSPLTGHYSRYVKPNGDNVYFSVEYTVFQSVTKGDGSKCIPLKIYGVKL